MPVLFSQTKRTTMYGQTDEILFYTLKEKTVTKDHSKISTQIQNSSCSGSIRFAAENISAHTKFLETYFFLLLLESHTQTFTGFNNLQSKIILEMANKTGLNINSDFNHEVVSIQAEAHALRQFCLCRMELNFKNSNKEM